MRKVLFLGGWLGLLSLSFLTVIRVTPLSLALASPVFFSNFLQRVLGLTVFTMFFVQIVLGAFIGTVWKKYADSVRNFHIFEGILAYILAFLHPMLYLLSGYFAGGKFDPYVAFINACLICKTPENYYLTIGRISFWLLSISVFAVLFRRATPWLKENWRKFHVLNYLVFLLVGAHGFLLGSDFRVQPFFTFAILAYAIVLGIVVFIELPRLYKNFKEWVNS